MLGFCFSGFCYCCWLLSFDVNGIKRRRKQRKIEKKFLFRLECYASLWSVIGFKRWHTEPYIHSRWNQSIWFMCINPNRLPFCRQFHLFYAIDIDCTSMRFIHHCIYCWHLPCFIQFLVNGHEMPNMHQSKSICMSF